MRSPIKLASALALAAALALGGCTSGGDATGTGGVPEADALVVLKPSATDLTALDLRDKLVALPGVEGVIYDQAVKRLRVDFTATASEAERAKVTETASADATVQQVRMIGDDGPAGDGPAPSGQPAAS